MSSASILSSARQAGGLTLRQLAVAAGTSHSTISAYEHGRKVPATDTLRRLVLAAGFELELELTPAIGGADPEARGDELMQVLELAAMFPARHDRELNAPIFGVR